MRKKKKRGKSYKARRHYRHAICRLKQRYHIAITEDEYDFLVSMIRRGKEGATFLEKRKDNATKWSIKYKDRVLIAIYDNKMHTISTFLNARKNKRVDTITNELVV